MPRSRRPLWLRDSNDLASRKHGRFSDHLGDAVPANYTEIMPATVTA